jgi:hypothetical protein
MAVSQFKNTPFRKRGEAVGFPSPQMFHYDTVSQGKEWFLKEEVIVLNLFNLINVFF